MAMTKDEIIEYLNEIRSDKFRKNIIKLGIPEEKSIGVSTGEIRKLARKIKIDHHLAEELWAAGYHEARLLSILIMDESKVSLNYVSQLMKDVMSWDLCDHICKNLIIKMPSYEKLIFDWCCDHRVYYKRAAFSLIASTMIHKKEIKKDEVNRYIDIIRECGDDSRNHVKKAVSWALREIGKKDFDCQEQAIQLAYEFIEGSQKNLNWIGKNALKELETLVSVKERGRLLSSNSKMGKRIQKDT